MESADADSGCSRGIFNTKESFVHLEPLSHPVYIEVADGSIMTATHGGIVHMYVHHRGDWNLLILEDQLYVPKAQGNLISLGRLTQFLYKVEMVNSKMTIYRVNDTPGEPQPVICEVEAVNHCFPIRYRLLPTDLDEHSSLYSSAILPDKVKRSDFLDKSNFALARSRSNGVPQGVLNHYRGMHIQGLFASYKCPDIAHGLCTCCALGSGENVKGASDGHRCYDRPMMLWSADSFGPVWPPDLWGNCYAHCCIDACTRYQHPYLTATLSEWKVRTDQLIKRCENHHNSALEGLIAQGLATPIRLAALRLDNSSAARSKDNQQDWADNGIRVEKIAPRAHHQNGLVETGHHPTNRHVISAMTLGNAPNFMWSCAWKQDKLCANLKKIPGKDVCPRELEYSMVANSYKSMLGRLRVLYCLAFPYISKEVRSKLDIRSNIAIHMGDAGFDGWKGYWFLLIETGVMIVCESASFNEGVLPMRDARVVEHLGMEWNNPKQIAPHFKDMSHLSICPRVEVRTDPVTGTKSTGKQRQADVSPTTFFGVSEEMVFSGEGDIPTVTQDELHIHDARKTIYNLGDPNFPTTKPIEHEHDVTMFDLPTYVGEKATDDESKATAPPPATVHPEPVRAPMRPVPPRRSGRAGVKARAEQRKALEDGPDEESWGVTYIYAPNELEKERHWQVDPEGSPTSLVLHVKLRWDQKGKSKPVMTWEPWTNLLDGESPMCKSWITRYKDRVDAWLPEVQLQNKAEVAKSAKGQVHNYDNDDEELAEMDVISAMAAVIGSPDMLGVLHLGPMADMEPGVRRVCLESRISAFYTSQMEATRTIERAADQAKGAKKVMRKKKKAGAPPPKSVEGLSTNDPPPLGMAMPKTLHQANLSPWAPQFIEAWNTEMYGLEARGVWEVVPITSQCLPLVGSTTIYDIKRTGDGDVDKFKVRMVAQGFSQRDGHNYDASDVYSPVVTLVVVRFLLAIFAAMEDVTISHFDISQAYLWADLEHDVYMRPFEGMNVPPGYCLKLIKALYGLKNSGSDWHKTFKRALMSDPLHFQQSEFDECVFTFSEGRSFIIVLIFVDDMLVFSNDPKLKKKLLARLNHLFKVDDRGDADWFLAIRIERNIKEGYVDLSQAEYCKNMVEKCLGQEVDKIIPVKTPETKEVLTKDQAPSTDEERTEMASFDFRGHGGRLLFTLTCCRPDLLHSIKMILQFSSNPGVPHKQAMKRIMRYVAGCPGAKLRLHGSRDYKVTLGAISDSDDANNPDHRRSLNCVLTFLGSYFSNADGEVKIGKMAFFDWSTQWTIYVAESSCVSELYAIAVALRKVKFFRPFLAELATRVRALSDLEQKAPTHILSDCESAVTIAEGQHPGRFKGTKHLERRFFSIQQAIQLTIVEMRRCASQLNAADIGCTYKDVSNFVQQRLVLMQNTFAAPSRPFRIEHQSKAPGK
jgi:hypothetical protein